MNRLTDNDKNWGPFTFARWKGWISLTWSSGGDEEEGACNHIRAIAFGHVLQMQLPNILKPFEDKYGTYPRDYGFSLTKEDERGYSFFRVFFGPQTHDSQTTKSWSKFIPWKQWNHVRHSIYAPDGLHFATEQKGKWSEWSAIKEKCPKSYFGFEDYDGEMIVATCTIEEREWHKGDGWFKWLKYFSKPMIRRSLDIWFSAEVGRGKGSWKGGTRGHGIEMLPGETPQQAFERYCGKGHSHKGDVSTLRFIGACKPPPPEPKKIQGESAQCGHVNARTA